MHSKGVLARFSGNTLSRMDSKMLGIDGLVDVIGTKDKAFVLNHVSLERIFMMNEHYNNAATEALNKLRIKDKILNFEQFEIDCLDDKRIQKTLTKMLNETEVFEHALEDFQAIENTIDIFNLDIRIEESNGNKKIFYETKDNLVNILRIIRDAYYKSTVQNRLGIDESI